MDKINHATLLSEFDALVSEGFIHHTSAPATRIVDGGYTFAITVSPTLTPKAKIDEVLLPSRGDTSAVAKAPLQQPRYGPGSDLLLPTPRMTIRGVRGTHLLVYNMFSIVRPQLLLITTDSYARQTTPLDASDIAATYDVLAELRRAAQQEGVDDKKEGEKRGFFAFYNCGKTAGGSRDHKHVQLAPRDGALFPDLDVTRQRDVPFTYFLHYHDHSSAPPTPESLIATYTHLLAQARASLSLPPDAPQCPHNAVMTLEWMLVIPRRQPEVALPVNVPKAPAMMGLVWLASEEVREKWLKYGPARMLASGGVAR